MSEELRCFSCAHCRAHGCAKGFVVWPHSGSGWCKDFEAEPGTSPAEFEDFDDYLAANARMASEAKR